MLKNAIIGNEGIEKQKSFANKMIKNVCLVAETTKSVDFELYLQNFCYDFG